jgi:hypothetical protein
VGCIEADSLLTLLVLLRRGLDLHCLYCRDIQQLDRCGWFFQPFSGMVMVVFASQQTRDNAVGGGGTRS